MKLTKNKSELNTYDVYLTDGNKELSILFAGNGDLYWIIKNKDRTDSKKQKFTITKENY